MKANNDRYTGYSHAPLPFQGQKRNFISQYQSALRELRVTFGVDTVVDLFGGSGLLSHVAKRTCPGLRVIYNDFDDYHVRLRNIQQTNALLAQMREITRSIPHKGKIPPELRQQILDVVKEREEQEGYVDYITLSSSVLFSGNFATNYDELSRDCMYGSVIQHNYDTAGYIDGLELEKKDYKELVSVYKGCKNVLFVVDPPYLSTDTSTYNSKGYWHLTDYLDVLTVLEDNPFIYFTSDKSRIVELCNHLEKRYNLPSPFRYAKVKTKHIGINNSGGYNDYMYYGCATQKVVGDITMPTLFDMLEEVEIIA
jgi:hypothetical protein